MKVSIIVCAYNERRYLPITLRRLRQYPIPGWQREIIVVDNNSTDGTQEWLKRLRFPHLKKIFHPQNLGKTASIYSGLRASTGEYILIQDADIEYHPKDHVKLAQRATTGAKVIYGSRVLNQQPKYKYLHTYLGVKFITFVTNSLFCSHLTDVATAMKMIKRSLTVKLQPQTNDFGWDFAVTAKLLSRGIPIAEVPISYHPRTYAQGKKITILDGLKALITILKVKFSK